MSRVVDVLGKGVLIVLPIHPSHTVCQDMLAVCRIPANNVSKLFSKLAEVT